MSIFEWKFHITENILCESPMQKMPLLIIHILANDVIGFSIFFRQFIQSSMQNLESVTKKMTELSHNYVIITKFILHIFWDSPYKLPGKIWSL